MRPKPRSRMPSITGRHMLNSDPRLVSVTAFHCSTVILCSVVSRVIPALFTRTSTGPRSASTFAMPAVQASKSETSHL